MRLKDSASVSTDEYQEIRENFHDIVEKVNEIKEFFRSVLSNEDYDQFKYRCLGNLEPGLQEETEWVTRYSSITSLEEYINRLSEEVTIESGGSLLRSIIDNYPEHLEEDPDSLEDLADGFYLGKNLYDSRDKEFSFLAGPLEKDDHEGHCSDIFTSNEFLERIFDRSPYKNRITVGAAENYHTIEIEESEIDAFWKWCIQVITAALPKGCSLEVDHEYQG